MVIIAVILHNTIGLLGGYWGGRLFGFDESTCRTLAIEVGMQNSGTAAALGKIYFGPLAALPGALFSVWHNLSGSLLAGYWSGKPIAKKSRQALSLIRPGAGLGRVPALVAIQAISKIFIAVHWVLWSD